MAKVLKDFDFVKVYLDDILIYSKTEDEHMNHIEMLIERLTDKNISINFDKCEFFYEYISYLGVIITGDGIKPDISRIEKEKIVFIPKNKRQLQKLLGVPQLV